MRSKIARNSQRGYDEHMRFTILHWLIATTALGATIGIAVRDGIWVAVVLAFLVALSFICIVRAHRRWFASTLPQRTYAIVTVVASLGLLASCIYSIGTSPSLARHRNVRHLQLALAQDQRFTNVRVEYSERKIEVVRVDGHVSTDDDFDHLRNQLSRYDWRKLDAIYWDVFVDKSRRSYEGWDEDLFNSPVTTSF
jgi:hypothetical protein